MSDGKNTAAALPSRAHAILFGLCPRCRAGRIHERFLKMAPRCGNCGLNFHREDGYFLGAMGIGYVMGFPVLSSLILVMKYFVFPQWPEIWLIVPAFLLFLPLVPLIVRYSRVFWIHLDRLVDPHEEYSPDR